MLALIQLHCFELIKALTSRCEQFLLIFIPTSKLVTETKA